MKKVLLSFAIAFFVINAFSQTNIFPTTGNVGIGTLTSNFSLTIRKDAAGAEGAVLNLVNSQYANSFGSSSAIRFQTGVDYRFAKISAIQRETGVTDRLVFGMVNYNDIYTEILTIKENGNVGIGTIAPYGKLHVFSQNSPSNYYDGELHVGGFIGHAEDMTLILGTHYNNKTTFLQGWRAGFGYAPILIQPQGGNVGIGTTSSWSGARLTVENTLATKPNGVDGYYSYLRSNWSQENAFEMGISDGSSWHKLLTSSNYHFGSTLQFWAADNERMRINADGNVGIGTTNPQYKLAVKGTIGCGEVKVEDVTSWPDFVFNPNYNLRPLSEVEQFVKTNNHLPEIPSEAEVKENGVNLGEMNAKLLQKLEELTLYLIEQDKKIVELQNQVKELNSKK